MNAISERVTNGYKASAVEAWTKRRQTGRIDVRGVDISYTHQRRRHVVIENANMTVHEGEIVCFLGPSGCGKSSLLNAIGGHLRPSKGSVLLDGVEVKRPSAELGMVFQQHTLFPWKTLLDNVAFGPRMRGISKAEARKIARQVIAMVGLERYEEYYPGALSGGMQHRGEIARALANYPAVLLMDEPFGALDAQTRINLQEGLLDVWARTNVTILFVTHDVDEAILLGDRVVVFPANRKTGLVDIKNPLKRPRSREVMLDRAFGELRKICLEMLKG